MSQQHGPFARSGSPGGPGCKVAALPISAKNADGSLTTAQLLDAGTVSTELELLRTVAKGMGIRWGKDDFGWWAVVPD